MKTFHDEDTARARHTPGVRTGGLGGDGTAHDTDAHNLRLIQRDARLQRILTAYRTLDEAGRERLAGVADELRAAGGDAA